MFCFIIDYRHQILQIIPNYHQRVQACKLLHKTARSYSKALSITYYRSDCAASEKPCGLILVSPRVAASTAALCSTAASTQMMSLKIALHFCSSCDTLRLSPRALPPATRGSARPALSDAAAAFSARGGGGEAVGVRRCLHMPLEIAKRVSPGPLAAANPLGPLQGLRFFAKAAAGPPRGGLRRRRGRRAALRQT